MSVIDKMKFIGEDTRRRRYLNPAKIISVTGDVRNPELLLKVKSLQIGLNEPDVTVFKSNPEQNAAVVLDFGRELHGGVRLMTARLKADHGSEREDNLTERFPMVRITFGESVAETVAGIGERNATNDHAIRDLTVPISFLSDQEYGQTGFRFVRIELLTPGVEVTFKSILAVMIYRELSYQGSFECSDELVNRIYDTSAYTCHLNVQNMVWDGIKRDRLVWIGDMHPETKTICAVFGELKTLEDSLEFVRDQTPVSTWMNGIPSYSMWWLIILQELYRHNGRTAFLDRQRDYVTALLTRLCRIIHEDGSDEIGFYFFDWPSSNVPGQVTGVRGILRLALNAGIELAGVYGDERMAADCAAARKRLDCGAEDPHELKSAAAFLALSGVEDAKKIAETKLLPGGAHGMSTFLAYYVLKAASLGGHTQEALDMMREYYGAMLDLGATSFWEDFNLDWIGDGAARIDAPVPEGANDIHGDHGAYCYVGLRHSLAHGWSSGPVSFLAESVLGIEILEPGCRKMRVRPELCDLTWAKGTYPTPYGKICVSAVKNADGSVTTEVEAPAEVEIVRE